MKYLIIIFLFLTACSSPPLPAGQVKTAQGIVQGVSADGITSFLGFEYATAARWALPQEGPSWAGVKHADSFGPSCPQDGQEKMVEACLFLNVFTPENASADSKLPVVVWIHGGGFREGVGGEGPKNWARENIIVVTFDYRLGVLGFRDWPGWDESDPRNFGQADMIAALDWVQQNISGFGGDPKRVTIVGHSAGGMGVQLMMVDPRARGKFAAAIAHAGYGAWPFPKAMNPTSQERQLIRYGALETGADVADLVALTPHYHLPFIGGSDLPEQPATSFIAGVQAPVPYITGFNSFDGYGTLAGAGFTPPSFLKMFKDEDGLRALYPDEFASGDELGAQRAFGDRRYGLSSRITARAMVSVGQPGYLFYFDEHSLPLPGAAHGAQYDDLFGDGVYPQKSYFLNFIKTGSPNGDDLPVWKPNTDMSDHWMVFTPMPKPSEGVLSERLDYFQSAEMQ